MDWQSFFLGAWGGIILSGMVFCTWRIFWLPKPQRSHVIYRKGQPPERVA